MEILLLNIFFLIKGQLTLVFRAFPVSVVLKNNQLKIIVQRGIFWGDKILLPFKFYVIMVLLKKTAVSFL